MTTEATEPTDKIATKCTHCARSILLQPGPDCPPLRVALWLKIIVCNRCGEYLEKRRKLTEAIQGICTTVGLSPPSAMAAAAGKARDALSRLTQAYVTLLSKRWTTINDWSDEMVSLLLSSPLAATAALKAHEREHRKARERADAEARERIERGE